MLTTRDDSERIIGFEITNQYVVITFSIVQNQYNVYSSKTKNIYHISPEQWNNPEVIGKDKFIWIDK